MYLSREAQRSFVRKPRGRTAIIWCGLAVAIVIALFIAYAARASESNFWIQESCPRGTHNMWEQKRGHVCLPDKAAPEIKPQEIRKSSKEWEIPSWIASWFGWAS